jgi:hypothetical protein
MVQLNRHSKAKTPSLAILSHLLSFAFGLAIYHLLNREDCYDIASKEITKQPTVVQTAVEVQTPTVAALRQTKDAVVANVSSKEKNFYELALKTGTDKVLGAKNLESCLKDESACGQPTHVKEECEYITHFSTCSYVIRC